MSISSFLGRILGWCMHKWSGRTIYDSINGPAGLFMSGPLVHWQGTAENQFVIADAVSH